MHTGTSTVLVGAHSRAVRSAKPWPRIDHFTCYDQGLIFGECLSTGIWVLLSLIWRSPGQFPQDALAKSRLMKKARHGRPGLLLLSSEWRDLEAHAPHP